MGIVFRLDDLGYLLIGNSRVDKRHTNVTNYRKGKTIDSRDRRYLSRNHRKDESDYSDEEMNTIIQSVDQIKELFK